MYGFYPKQHIQSLKLKPALSLHSRLLQTKRVNKGDYISYDNAYQAQTEQWIGTVPIGYADGWTQSMQHTDVLVGGCRAKVIGKISMDQLMVQLPEFMPPGEKVTLIGSAGEECISIQELADHIGSVPQEISSSITNRVTRTYKRSGGKANERIPSEASAL